MLKKSTTTTTHEILRLDFHKITLSLKLEDLVHRNNMYEMKE